MKSRCVLLSSVTCYTGTRAHITVCADAEDKSEPSLSNKASTQAFYPMVSYANYLSCIICIFKNINEHLKYYDKHFNTLKRRN